MTRYRKKQRESDVERKIVLHAKRLGVLQFKFNSEGCPGVPDRIFIYHGTTVYLEIKRPGEVPRPLQKFIGQAIRNHGCTWEYVDNVEAGIAFLNRLVAGDFSPCGCLKIL